MTTALDVRYRSSSKTENTISAAFQNGSQVFSGTFNRWYNYHWMADRINPVVKDKGYRPPGFCQHLKIDKTYVAPMVTFVKTDGTVIVEMNPDGTGWDGQSPTGSPTDPIDHGYGNLLTDFFQTPRFSDLCFEAWTKLKTQVPTDVELLNFIYELKDFGPLAKSLSKAKGLRGKSIGQNFSEPLKGKTVGGKVKRSAKAVNDTFLAYNFMWAPFIGDLIKLTKVADNVAKRMAFLRSTRGKEVTVRFQKTDCYINSALGVPQTYWENADWKRNFLLTKYQCDFVVTCKLFQDLEGLDDAWADLRATFASLGINNPLKAVWQAIPFSFLVDWVAPIGKWLERAAVQPFKGTWRVYDITTSVRERGEIENERTNKSGGVVATSDRLITRVKIDRYTRLIGLPQTLGAIDFTQLTQQQQKLFLSLVLTKVV